MGVQRPLVGPACSPDVHPPPRPPQHRLWTTCEQTALWRHFFSAQVRNAAPVRWVDPNRSGAVIAITQAKAKAKEKKKSKSRRCAAGVARLASVAGVDDANGGGESAER